jgi:hypothetical protein
VRLGDDDPLGDPLNRFELDELISGVEGRPLTIDPNHPPMVQDEHGGWWSADVSEEERVEIRRQLRELFNNDND